jgi:hypothetical protein
VGDGVEVLPELRQDLTTQLLAAALGVARTVDVLRTGQAAATAAGDTTAAADLSAALDRLSAVRGRLVGVADTLTGERDGPAAESARDAR